MRRIEQTATGPSVKLLERQDYLSPHNDNLPQLVEISTVIRLFSKCYIYNLNVTYRKVHFRADARDCTPNFTETFFVEEREHGHEHPSGDIRVVSVTL